MSTGELHITPEDVTNLNTFDALAEEIKGQYILLVNKAKGVASFMQPFENQADVSELSNILEQTLDLLNTHYEPDNKIEFMSIKQIKLPANTILDYTNIKHDTTGRLDETKEFQKITLTEDTDLEGFPYLVLSMTDYDGAPSLTVTLILGENQTGSRGHRHTETNKSISITGEAEEVESLALELLLKIAKNDATS